MEARVRRTVALTSVFAFLDLKAVIVKVKYIDDVRHRMGSAVSIVVSQRIRMIDDHEDIQ